MHFSHCRLIIITTVYFCPLTLTLKVCSHACLITISSNRNNTGAIKGAFLKWKKAPRWISKYFHCFNHWKCLGRVVANMFLEEQALIKVEFQVFLVCLEFESRGTYDWEIQLWVWVIMCSRKVKDLWLVILHDQAKCHYQVCNYSIATIKLWQGYIICFFPERLEDHHLQMKE